MWYIENRNSTTFNIHGTCNEKCPFCSGYPKIDFTLDWLQKKVKGLPEISLQGWEPTMSPFLFDLLEYARNHGTNFINLITNGLKIQDINFARKLKWKVDCYHFAFMSHKRKKSDLLWGSADALREKSRWILNLIRIWDASKIRLVHIIQKDNIPDLLEFPVFISKRFPWVRLIEFKYLQYFWNKNNLWKILMYSDTMNIFNQAFKICENLGINFIINGIPLCFIEEKYHKFTASYYNNNSEKEMKNYSTVKLNKCRTCSHSKNCIWVRQDYILLNGDNEFK